MTFSYRGLPDLTGGACITATNEQKNAFHPSGSGTSSHQIIEAKRLCGTCPADVRTRCLADAMAWEADTGSRWGIWGGLTEIERDQLADGGAA